MSKLQEIKTLTRKQREIEDREKQILDLARPVLASQGYQALSMDRLATEMQYAKGTLYNHFPNKEEIIAALALDALKLRGGMFEFVSRQSPHSRHRMAAIGVACQYYATQFAQHFAIEQMLRNSIIWEKASPKRQQLIRDCEFRSMGIVAGLARDGVATGELKLPEAMSCEEFVFGFWALTFGSQTLIASSPSLPDININNPHWSVRFHAWTLMNGYDWQPLVTFKQSESFREGVLKTLESFHAN